LFRIWRIIFFGIWVYKINSIKSFSSHAESQYKDKGGSRENHIILSPKNYNPDLGLVIAKAGSIIEAGVIFSRSHQGIMEGEQMDCRWRWESSQKGLPAPSINLVRADGSQEPVEDCRSGCRIQVSFQELNPGQAVKGWLDVSVLSKNQSVALSSASFTVTP